jgi:putative ABC transport system ATP-binding protein
MSESNTILETRDVYKSYFIGKREIPVLRGINLGIGKGEFTALVGPSGCGKSTLLYLLGGLARPTRGSIFIAGSDSSNVSDRCRVRLTRENIGFVFQRFNLLASLSAYDNVGMSLRVRGNGRVPREAVENILKRVGMADKMDRRPSELSAGEEQRVAIARALVHAPAVILADEATGNLDSDNAKAILELFQEINAAGQTIVMVTHNLEAAGAAGRIIRMKDGKII